MSRVYMGIDPGSIGYISVCKDGEWKLFSLKDNHTLDVSKFLKEVRNNNDDLFCVMEHVHAIFGAAAGTTFSFGEVFGSLKALLIAHDIPYDLVPPKTWQKEIWSNTDMVYTYQKRTVKGKEVSVKKTDTKATSLNAARRLFPNMDFRRSERCKKADDNLVDSVLIAEYARRKNL